MAFTNATKALGNRVLTSLETMANRWWASDTDGFHFLSHFLIDDATRIFHMWVAFGEEGFTDSELLTFAFSWAWELANTCADVLRQVSESARRGDGCQGACRQRCTHLVLTRPHVHHPCVWPRQYCDVALALVVRAREGRPLAPCPNPPT